MTWYSSRERWDVMHRPEQDTSARVIVLGASGYVGRAFVAGFKAKHIDVLGLSRAEVDYSNSAEFADYLERIRPQFVVNAAGYTGRPNVDACEDNKAACLFGNAVLPGQIAQACKRAGIPWGHVSSGCIYTGGGPGENGFSEGDAPNFCFRTNNCSWYSGTKALGEEVLSDYTDLYVWRLRIPFGRRDEPRNYLSKLMHYERILDATNSISNLDEFVGAAIECWQRKVPYGIYNMTNPGSITAREIVQLIEESRVSCKAFSFFSDEAEFMRLAARTPRSNCVLNTDKLSSVGIQMTPVRESLAACLRDWITA